MSRDILSWAAIIVPALAAAYVAIRHTRVGSRSASATEVESLGKRLDAQVDRIDRLERTNRALYAYIAADHAVHITQGWPIIPLPAEVA